MKKDFNVVSFFDGMSCGQLALERVGIDVTNYYACEVDKYASLVTRSNYPNTIELGDVTKVHAKDLPNIDLLIGGSPCFIAGTPILCYDIIRNIDEVKEGNFVLTHNNRYRKVLKVGGDEKEIYKLSTQNSITSTTENHPYYIRTKTTNDNVITFNNPEWIKIKDIKEDSYVGTPILNTCRNELNLTEEDCYLLGISAYWYNIPFHKNYLDLPIHLLKKILDGFFYNNKNTYISANDNCINSVILAIAKVYRISCKVEFTNNVYILTFNENDKPIIIDDIIWIPILDIEKTDKKERVFNIEVEEDNSYIANNHIVHNCQGFSFAGKQLNFEDPRSKLFFEFVRMLEEIRVTNPDVLFLLENVKMKKEYQDIITEYLGVQPIEINSNVVSAQNRKRIYWTNIPNVTQPEDKGILLKDIIHETNDNILDIEPETSLSEYKTSITREKQNVYLSKYLVPIDKTLMILDKEIARGKVGFFRTDSQANRVYYIHDKSVTLVGEAGGGGGAAKMSQYLFGVITPDRINKRQNGQRFNDGRKFYTLTAQDKHGIIIEGYIRKLTPIECERLQTVPDNYTNHVSETQRYKMLGNGWTVDVIAHILKNINK